MGETDDLHRYIEFYQRTIHSQGWESFHDPATMRAWLANNAAKLDATLAEQYRDIGSPSGHLEKLLGEFQPKTAFDSPYAAAIFAPLLEQVILAAERIGIKPIRKIEIATSTDVSSSPVSLPTQGSHFLFIGLGTSSFCNYWAKAFTAVVWTLRDLDPSKTVSGTDDLRAVLKNHPEPLLLAARLALAYAIYGSALGFGQVVQPATYLGYRLQLLTAMEIFIVSHEFAHMVAEEQFPQFRGYLEPEMALKLEHLCDEVAVAISREWANEQHNSLAFAGIGALLFFRAMELCELARNKLMSLRQILADTDAIPGETAAHLDREVSHPSFSDRIATIKSLTISLTAEDERTHVATFLEEYDRIATGLSFLVLEQFPDR